MLYFLIEVYLICNTVLLSGIQNGGSVFLQIILHCKLLQIMANKIIPCVIQCFSRTFIASGL